MDTPDRKKDFEGRMAEIAKEEKRLFRQSPIYYVNMLFEHGADGTAIHLIRRPQASEKFWQLVQAGRPDLTVESVILNEFPDRPWVTEADLSICRQRLAQARTA